MSETQILVALIITALAFGFFGWMFGFFAGIASQEKQAVRDGKAEYYLDENFNKRWRWKNDL